MPSVVLYATDLEPITILDIPSWAVKRLRAREPIRFPVFEKITLFRMTGCPAKSQIKSVTVWFEPIRREEYTGWLAFTDDEYLALSLRSDTLPGQRGAFQEEYRKGFNDALLGALE